MTSSTLKLIPEKLVSEILEIFSSKKSNILNKLRKSETKFLVSHFLSDQLNEVN